MTPLDRVKELEPFTKALISWLETQEVPEQDWSPFLAWAAGYIMTAKLKPNSMQMVLGEEMLSAFIVLGATHVS